MDLSVILNPSPQSQCSVNLGGEVNQKSQLHSPPAESGRVTERETNSDIHRGRQQVNGCLGQPSAVLNLASNNRIPCPSSSSAPSLAPRRDNYYDQNQDQTLFAKVPRQISIAKPLLSSRSLKDSAHYSEHIISSNMADQVDLQSDTVDLAHSSSLETLASVATANAAVRHPSHEDPQTSCTLTEVPLQATFSRSSESGPTNHYVQQEQYEGATPEDFDYPANLDSRRSSYISGTARVKACMTDSASTTEEGPSCSYTAGCSTGSPLRKVVSHIFGRNKLCTKQIPKSVWVCYCRKHYQRSRYRNPAGFALLQCDLLRKQIDRIDMWGGVSDWIIKIRKREEKRLNQENAELAARRVAENAASDGDDDMDVVRDARQQTFTRASLTSSRWLIRFTGSGKTTQEVREVLDIIETQIRDTKCKFPDIEILPNISLRSHGSDHQRSVSSWSSSSLSSSPRPDDGVDHQETQRPKRTTRLNARSSPAKSPAKRRTLQRGTRSSRL